MPIRFNCKRCHQLLGIAGRKAGNEIECPKCGCSQVVPNQEAALAAMAMDQYARNHEADEGTSSLMVYDDQPAPIEAPRSARPPEAAASTATSTGAAPSAARPEAERGRPVPSGMILYSRRTLYVQGALLLIFFTVGFGSGYLIGRGGAEERRRKEQAAKERILVEGTLIYDRGAGLPSGDENAVVIALPAGKSPPKKISFQGVRPQVAPIESDKAVRMIRELGGEYARADASGEYSMVVPDRGKYHLLIISNHATRPEGADLDEADRVEMQRYFSKAELVIRRQKYRWWSREINRHDTIDYDFGRDGQENRQP